MSGHTETPWQAGSENIDPVNIFGSDGERLVAAAGGYQSTDAVASHEENNANATFIVTAVNAHEKLVAMLEWAEWIGSFDTCRKCGKFKQEGHRDDCELAALLREVRE